jgi:hypothetical protein
MVNDNLSQHVEPCYYLVKQEESYGLTIIFKRWHRLDPLCELVYYYDDIMMPPCERRVACGVINPPLGEGTNCDDGKYGSGVCPHLPREDLTWVALLDQFKTIFD